MYVSISVEIGQYFGSAWSLHFLAVWSHHTTDTDIVLYHPSQINKVRIHQTVCWFLLWWFHTRTEYQDDDRDDVSMICFMAAAHSCWASSDSNCLDLVTSLTSLVSLFICRTISRPLVGGRSFISFSVQTARTSIRKFQVKMRLSRLDSECQLHHPRAIVLYCSR